MPPSPNEETKTKTEKETPQEKSATQSSGGPIGTILKMSEKRLPDF